MVKQKRNTTGTAEFTGFAAFASHTSSAAVAVKRSQSEKKESAPSSGSRSKFKPNPIYTGTDTQLIKIFKRITKKDATTKTRALAELADYAYPCDTDTPDKPKSASTPPLQKNEQVTVLAHFFYLFSNKLIHDNNPSVRSEAMRVLGNAMVHVPKACNGLLRQDAVNLDVSGNSNVNVGAIGNAIGWIYSFQSSQVMEVLKVSKRVWNLVMATLDKFHDAEESDVGGVEAFVKLCIVSHSESILQASSRATNLAEALSVAAQKNQSAQNKKIGKGGKGQGGKGQPDTSSDDTGPSASEKEEMEERYERVVLLTVRGMTSLLNEYPEGEGDDICSYNDMVTQPNILWKHLNSVKGSFRRATFALISCIAQKATSLIHQPSPTTNEGAGDRKKSNLSLLLLNILSSERDPANFAALFEMILLFIASFREFDGGVKMAWEAKDSDQGCCRGIDSSAFVKSMSKTLKRACYGSPSPQWAPTMLPIIVTLQLPEQQLQLLSSLWNGRTAAVGAADSMAIVTAVAECSMYLLVQSKNINDEVPDTNTDGDNANDDEVDQNEIAMDMSQIFLDCISYYLTLSPGGSASLSAERNLSSTLIRDLFKLDTLSLDRDLCKFARVRSWFWSEGISSTLSELDIKAMSRLGGILDGMKDLRDSKNLEPGKGFQTSLRDLFWKYILPNCGTSPSTEHLSLMNSLFKFCNVQFMFDANTSAASFCEEALIPWIANQPQKYERSLDALFDIFFLILNDFDEVEKAQTAWKHCLSQVVTKDHSLRTLIAALNIVFAKYSELVDVIRCSDFDIFATGVANRAEAFYKIHAGANLGNGHLLNDESSFLKLSTGLNAEASKPLVSFETINSWVHIVLSHDFEYGIYNDRHLLLEIIVSFACSGLSVLGSDLLVAIIIRAWKEGGPAWYSDDLKTILSSDKDLRSKVLSTSSETIKQEIQSENILKSTIDFDSYLWADRTTRVLDILHQTADENSSPTAFVGLNSIEFWASSMTSSSMCEKLYLSFMYLLQKQADESEIISFIEDEDSNIWTIHVFMAFVCFKGSNTRRCANLAHLLGDHLCDTKIDSLIYELIDMLSTALQENSVSISFTNRATILLDWFIGMRMPKFAPARKSAIGDDSIDQNEIKEGDKLWYIIDSSMANSERIKVKVLKVHTDDLPNLYFSILGLENDGSESKTKQTIATRLKRHNQRNLQNESASSQPVDSRTRRLEESLITKLVQPFIQGSSEHGKDIAAEILNIAISYCGLQGKSGIGTTRYDVFQIFSSREQELIASLLVEDTNFISLKSDFERFSIILGFGILTSNSRFNSCILKYNGVSLLDVIEEATSKEDSFFKENSMDGRALCSIIMRWLGATATVLKEDNAACMWNVMHIASSNISVKDIPEQAITLFLHALEDMNNKSAELPQSVRATTIYAEHSCMSNLFSVFALWDASSAQSYDIGEYLIDDYIIPEHDADTCLLKDFQAFIAREVLRSPSAIAHGAKMQVESLLTCLCSPKKQWHAFHALITSARKGDMFHLNDDFDLSKFTNHSLDKWTEGVGEEEAIEIEEDVFATAQWLPSGLMSDLEKWKDDSLAHDNNENVNERALTARLLKWIICLEYFDSAGNTDMRNRAHICSYIEKTGSIKEIFDIAASFSDFSTQDPGDLFDCISVTSRQAFTLHQISTLAIFRSIELMPTLCKSWWNEDCPRSLQIELEKFVESMVAPETLRRELERINRSSELGELKVTGSCVSREVVATYIQDECKLSVLIRVPSSFPFRNAEVDCQKTLGISEKRWRFWSLQIMRMLNGQDGSVLDALLLWKQNVEKEFDGVEPCPVCYSVLCVKTHAMPNLECKTCHNRFHSGCLYKWFNSSGKNQCVLCQQPWSGNKVI